MGDNNRVLAIDDQREVLGADLLARTFNEGKKALELLGPWRVLYLDHDLGDKTANYDESGNELTGYDIVKFIEENPKHAPEQVVLITGNPVGRARMQAALEQIYELSDSGGLRFFSPRKV